MYVLRMSVRTTYILICGPNYCTFTYVVDTMYTNTEQGIVFLPMQWLGLTLNVILHSVAHANSVLSVQVVHQFFSEYLRR